MYSVSTIVNSGNNFTAWQKLYDVTKIVHYDKNYTVWKNVWCDKNCSLTTLYSVKKISDMTKIVLLKNCTMWQKLYNVTKIVRGDKNFCVTKNRSFTRFQCDKNCSLTKIVQCDKNWCLSPFSNIIRHMWSLW